MDIGDGMCYSECYEVCKSAESQTCIPGANNTLYVNLKNKKFLKRREGRQKIIQCRH